MAKVNKGQTAAKSEHLPAAHHPSPMVGMADKKILGHEPSNLDGSVNICPSTKADERY
jgi:hypothetical protein